MLLVSEDLSTMTVWTILYYTRYLGKLSTRSLSYLCPDLPSVVRKYYNRSSLWLWSSCERASFKCNKAQVRLQTRLHIHTHLHSSEQFHVLCGRQRYNQIHYRWYHKTDAASTWHKINGNWMFNDSLFQTQVTFVSCDNRLAVFLFKLYII